MYLHSHSHNMLLSTKLDFRYFVPSISCHPQICLINCALIIYLIISHTCVIGVTVGDSPTLISLEEKSTPLLEIETFSSRSVSFEEYLLFNTNNTLLENNVTQNKVMALLSNTTYLLDTLVSENFYDRKIRPGFGGKPLTIYTDIEIRSFGPISENEMIYSMDCYFRQTWWDQRLQFDSFRNNGSLMVLSMDWKFLQRVWIPDTTILNGKSSYLHKVTVPNKFIRVRQDGQLRYSMRLTIKASCPMHLRKYPLDMQSCGLEIGSFGYTSRDLVYKWKGLTPVVISDDVTLSQYNFVNITSANITKTVTNGDERSSIMVRFILQRRRGYFMLQIYAPCVLIVGASWVSFWINRSDAAGRVSVGATTVLTLVTMGFGGRVSLPRVAYTTALDWFIVMCFAFVFTAMVEYACVNFVDHMQAEHIQELFKQKLQKLKLNRNNSENNRTDTEENDNSASDGIYTNDEVDAASIVFIDEDERSANLEEARQEFVKCLVVESEITDNSDVKCQRSSGSGGSSKRESDKTKGRQSISFEKFATIHPSRGEKVDQWSRIAFPLAFAFLNALYWILYLYTIDDELDVDFENISFV